MRDHLESGRAEADFEGGAFSICESLPAAVSGVMEEPVMTPQPPAHPVAIRQAASARFSIWWLAASSNLRGSILMVSAFAFFAFMTTLIKLVGAGLPLAEILLVRQVIVLAMMMIVVRGRVITAMRTKRPFLQILRGSFSLGAMGGGFSAIIHMPMAEATALGFSQVLFVTLAAIVILGETVDLRRWIAMAIGFAGVLVMLRPSTSGMNIYALYAIIGSAFGAGITITVRILSNTERTETIMFWQGAVLVSAMSVPAYLYWVPPSPTEWLWLISLGVVGTAGQWLITRAYQIGEASALAPLDFVRLLLAAASGYLVFAEVPGLITILGAALVLTGTILTVTANSRTSKSVLKKPVVEQPLA
ncbi:MAG: hypothetical protein CFE31_07645 [Rhizobiales bacterium PAR1]|nr:MAG: hypothetical protein CFE31_07645 [Rhizobiales bacterium PAR1]